jgi:hypothetical protein
VRLRPCPGLPVPQATKIQTALTTAVDLVGTQRHLWVSLLGLAIAVGSSNGVTSLGTDLRDLISLLAAAAVAAYPGPGVQECNIPAAVDKLKSGTVAQRAFLSAARGHVQDSAATSVPYPLGSAPDPAITTTVVVAGLLATRDVVMLRLGVPKADAGKPGGDTLWGPETVLLQQRSQGHRVPGRCGGSSEGHQGCKCAPSVH